MRDGGSTGATELTPDAIRALRRRLGLTQVGLAERVGCTSQAVAFWEQGRRSPTGLYARAVRQLLAEPMVETDPSSPLTGPVTGSPVSPTSPTTANTPITPSPPAPRSGR